MLDRQHYDFAVQCGAADVVVHLADYFNQGDIQVAEVIRILEKNAWDGVIILDHAPRVACEAPWHAGMAHALGYLKALVDLAVVP